MEVNSAELEEILKVLADKTRLEIIFALKGRSLAPGEIEVLVNKSQSATSQQLKKLADANILAYRQEGARKLFQIRNPQIFDLLQSVYSYSSTREVREAAGTEEPGKIVFMGLDGSGKTSIILSLRGDRNLLSYYNLEPTPGLDVGTDLRAAYWECGGQEVYREEYLADPDKFLGGADRLVFVIDVQDIPRYNEALEYLEQIVAAMSQSAIECDVSVYLHKWDPTLPNTGPYAADQLNLQLTNKIKEVIPPQFNYQVYRTTIFTVFQKTLLLQMAHT